MKHQTGFTLIEIAVVITIIGLLVGSLMIPLATQIDNAKIQNTNDILAQVKEALLRYASTNKRLPCPANATDTGLEDTTLCSQQGNLPWATLGVSKSDAWGHPFQYRVYETYAQANGLCLPNNTLAGICLPPTSTDLAIEIENATILSDVAVVVFSYGKNGHHDDLQALSNILWRTAVAASPDSYPCVGGTKQCYAKGNYIPNSFDDNFTWLTRSTLVDHLVTAGKMQIAVSQEETTLPVNNGIVSLQTNTTGTFNCTDFPNWGGCVRDQQIDWCQDNCPELQGGNGNGSGEEPFMRDVGNTTGPAQ